MSYTNLTPQRKELLRAKLTDRQLEIVQARLDGHSFRKIGRSLGLDEATVRGHWNRALSRLAPHLNGKDIAA